MAYESNLPKGRGGRGAAILQALEQIQKLPVSVNGSSSNGLGLLNGSSSNGPGIVKGSSLNSKNDSSVPRKPMGRGRFLEEALKASQEIGLSNTTYMPMRPLGRGSLFDIPEKTNHKYPNSDYNPISEEKEADLPESLLKNKIEEEEKQDIDKVANNIMKIKLREKINKKGTSGEDIPLTANYISLAVKPGQVVYIYEIKFLPQLDSKDLRYRIIKRQSELFGEYRSFDGALLFIPQELKSNQFAVNVDHPVDQSKLQMLVRLVAKKQVQDCPHILNILFKKIMLNLQMVRFGRYLYDPSIASEIPQYRLEVWPGLITSVAIVDGGIQICCDATHRVLRTQTVYELIKELHVANPRDFKSECAKKLLGSSVLTRYNNKLYRIDDILWDTSPRGSFKMNDNKEITFVEYYFKNYNIQIIDENQPLLISKYKSQQKKTEVMLCLVPELCYMTGLSQDMRDDFQLMKNLATYTHLTPQQRLFSFQKFFDQVRATPACIELLKGWGLSLMPETVRIIARQLKQEQIILGDDQVVAARNAEWNINRRIYAPIEFKEWIILHLHKDNNVTNQFVTHIDKIAPHFGIIMNTPKIITIPNEKIESYVKSLKKALTPTVQMVVVITPTNRGDRYAAIKKICCVENPIPSQVILSRSLLTKLSIVTPKILFQMNCKLGGSTWGVQIPYKKVMVCGIDTYHSVDTRSSSVGAFVSSLNSECTRWCSHVDFQGAKIEFLNSLSSFMTVALSEYYKVNHFLPDRIIIYRDGVGQGQLNMCKEYEIPQVYQGMKLYLEDYSPQLTFIVCQKRINTRFFLNVNNTLDNPPPGTVVDNTVTNPDLFDFYLISQKVRKGTVSPTHYIVVHNDSTMTPDQVQKFTYKMTYLYYNWNGTVRVPASCQYAHKLAQLVGQYLKVKPSKKLMDKLYYL